MFGNDKPQQETAFGSLCYRLKLMDTVGNPKHAFEFTEFRILGVKNPDLGFVLAITERRLSKQENLDSLFPWRFIRSFQWW